MSEIETINAIKSPHTRSSLCGEFGRIGVSPGVTIVVHTSLSSLGWICGGPVALIQALMDAVTPKGNILMTTFSAGCSEPSLWENPPVPESWWQTIRDEMPVYHPKVTPTRGVGVVPEVFRSFDGVYRSDHPVSSFAAWGNDAPWLIRDQGLTNPMGENSPIAKVYELDGSILLIGVGHEANTSMHLAETRAAGFPRMKQGSSVKNDQGHREWVEFSEPEYDSGVFIEIGKAFEATNDVSIESMGQGKVRLIRQRPIVDFALEYLESKLNCAGD